MSRVVFTVIGLSVALLLAGFVRGRDGAWVAWTLPTIAGLVIAFAGPELWRETVFLDFGY